MTARRRAHTALIATATAAALLLAACSSSSDTGGPTTSASSQTSSSSAAGRSSTDDSSSLLAEPGSVTLRFSGSKAPLAPDYATMDLVKQWQQDTGVNITWENLPDNVYQEKKNLILASGDLPDAFYNTGFTDTDIATYGSNGTLIPLEGLIDQYAPNLKAIFDKRPEIKAAVTASDGHIYTLPSAEELGIGAVPFFPSINQAWLDKLGLKMPTTVQEYHDTLMAFKTKDPNGNGKADEIPLSFINGWWCADIGDLFAALSGMPDNPDHRIVRDNKVIYTAAQPEYRDAISQLHTWYTEGLIDPESFTQDDKAYLAKGKTDSAILGSYIWWETEEVVGTDRAKDYALMPVLRGVKGQLVGHSNGGDYSRNAFAITSANQHPDITMKWVDRLYDPVMSAQVSWGPIGVTLEENPKGILVQKTLSAGTSAGELRQKVAPGGPHVTLKEDFQTVVAPEPRAEQRLKDLERLYLPYAEKQWYPTVFFSLDELDELSTIETDIKTLVTQKRAEWIVNGGVEQEWDGYVEQLNKIGLDRMMEIYQAAYDRYMQGK